MSNLAILRAIVKAEFPREVEMIAKSAIAGYVVGIALGLLGL